MPRVNLLDLHGEPVNVEQSDVNGALDAGYKVPSPEQLLEYKKQSEFGEGFGNELKAFGEGAARSATFGASDYLLPKIPGGPTTEALSERQKRNPVSSFAGNAAGVLGSVLLPEGGLVGGASKLASGAAKASGSMIEKAAGSLLSKVGSTAIGSGVLGSLYGAGNVVSEAALGDPDLTAQKALAHIGVSGLLAGGLGAAFSAGKLALPKAIELAQSAKGLAESAIKEAPGASIENAVIGDASHDSGLVKNMAKYAVDAAKMVLPHGVVQAVDVGRSLLKAQTLAGLEEMALKTTNSIAKAANNIFESNVAPLVVAKAAKNLTEDYDKAVTQVQDLGNFDHFINKMDESTKDVYPHAPQITNHMQMVMASAASFLNSKIPKAQVEAPLSDKFVPSKAEQQDFLHYYNVVNNPLIALGEMKRGSLTKGTIEALTAVHPKLYQEMRQQLMSKLMDVKSKGHEIPYQTKAMLTQFLQDPMDESFLPASIMSTQNVYMGPQRSSHGASGVNSKSIGRVSGLSKLNVAGRARLSTQKVNLGQKL